MRRGLALVVTCGLALSVAAEAHAMIFANVPGIPGSSTVVGHEGEIEVQSLGFSGGQVVRKSGAKLCAPPSEKTQLTPLTIQKVTDLASPKLFAAAAGGTVFDDVTITVAAVDQGTVQDVARYVLRNAFVSTYETASSGDQPSETISLQFERMDFTNLSPVEETATWNFCGAPD
jgi:type VI secretion system secreted protein Hcp